jgi:regulator of RNase E activity RraA
MTAASTTLPTDDAELFATIRRELFTAVVGDVLDVAGHTRQFLPPGIGPFHPAGSRASVVVGRAMPLLEADLPADRDPQAKPFGLMMQALDDLKPGEVYACTGSSPTYALWGGLMTVRAMKLGAAGAALDGFCRDSREIATLDFPVFSAGLYAQDQAVRGSVVDYRCTVTYRNGTVLRPGDLMFGDVDGVLVIPREFERDALAAALEKVRGENTVRKALESGVSAQEAFATYGIL